MKKLLVLGSTGSIGRQTLAVVRDNPGRFQVVGLAAGSDAAQLEAQVKEFEVQWVALGSGPFSSQGARLADSLAELIDETAPDLVVNAVSGAAGLPAAVRTLERGADLAVANKESLVVAGELLGDLATRHGGSILPVDSEHSAIFQCLRAGARQELRRVHLTASGGPFRGWSRKALADVTPQDALRHPTWKMGPKITIDSATLMNKALEVLEARALFGLEADQVQVVVHPESVVHSLVEFQDGSWIGHLGAPDMRVPIQYALSHPERWERPPVDFSLSDLAALHFEELDADTFPSVDLAFRVWKTGGTASAVFNAANEVAVARFLAGDLTFLQIFQLIEAALDQHHAEPVEGLEHIYAVDRSTREYFQRWTP